VRPPREATLIQLQLVGLAEARADVDQYGQLRAMWRTRPVSSTLTFEAVC
jgi:hypothetical protein